MTLTAKGSGPRLSSLASNKWLLVVVLCVGQLMIVVDATIVNVALPVIERQLGFSESSLAWVVNAYLLSFGGFLLLSGRLGDLLGRKRVLLVGLSVFTVGSFLCGLSTSQILLIVARFVQGLGGAAVSAVVLAILVNMLPDPRERTKAMGVYSFVASAGGAVGLLLGGILTQALSWHWIFFVNVPIGAVAITTGALLVPNDRAEDRSDKGVDVLGAIVITSALLLAVFTIVKAGTVGWGSLRSLCSFGVALLLVAGFVVRESRIAHPLVPLRVFRSRNLSGANAIIALWVMGIFGWFYLTALYLQHVLGYSVLGTGLAFFPANIVISVTSLSFAPRLVRRIGAKPVLIGAFFVTILGLALFSRVPVHASFLTEVLPGMLLLGLGLGFGFMPVLLLGMADASREDSGLASGLINTSQQMGAALGLAVLASIAASKSGELEGHDALKAALVGGYRLAFVVAACCSIAAIVLGLCVLRSTDSHELEDLEAIAHH